MARVYTYLFITTGIMMLLYLAGIPTTSGYILQYFDPINNPQNFANTEFYTTITGLLIALLAAGAFLGYLFKINPESYIIAGFCGILILFVGDMLSIITYYNGAYGSSVAWMGYVINLLLFPVVIGYALSIISFWRGAD